jgi:hypothetical protein
MYYQTTYPSPVGIITLASDGSGLVKVKLLELEGADMSWLFVPTRGTAL